MASLFYKPNLFDLILSNKKIILLLLLFILAVHHGLSSSLSSYNINESPYQTSPDRKINKIITDENDTEMEVTTPDEVSPKN